ELHDGVGQSVAMVALALDRLALAWSSAKGVDVPGELRLLAEDVRDANRRLRDELNDLSQPRRGAEVGPALAAHLGRVAARGLARPHLELDDDGSLADEMGDDVFQIAKEALTNVERHAPGAQVTLRFV